MTEAPTPARELGPLKYAGQIKTHSFAAPVARMRTFAIDGPLEAAPAPRFNRADIVVDGVDHSGPSFEVRVFGNNANANATTETTIENGYLGSFHVFGHGFCFGDVGHCEVNNRGTAATDLRGPHPLAPAQKIVVATDAIKALIARDGAVKGVSLVPIAIGTVPQGTDPNKVPEVLKYKDVRLVTYD
ncbi:hypothetical protein BH11PSE4_BH11PSE4_23020 [soil metagenome]